MARIIRCLVALFTLLLFPALASGACSSFAGSTSGPTITGKVSINEYNYSGNYVELKVLDPNVRSDTSNFQNWVLSVYKGSNNRTDFPVSSAVGSCSADSPYLKIPTGNLGNDTVLVLWSDTLRTQEVDYFRVGQNSYPNFQATTCFAASEVPNTSTRTYHQVPLLGSSAHKDIARAPDGTGAWMETPYNGADQGTSCTSNDATLAVSKTVSSASEVWIGENVSFRITAALDSRAQAQSSVIVTDLLPLGFSYGNHTASTGIYTSSNGEWVIGGMSAGASATLDIVAATTAPGSLFNSAAIQSIDFPSGTVAPVSASVIAQIPGVTNVVSPALSPLNGTATFTITVTNPSLVLTAPAFSVNNTLSPGLVFVSATPAIGTFAGSANGVWSIPGLAPGASTTLTVAATVTQSGALTDSAQVVLNTFAPASASAVATVTGAPPEAFNAWVNPSGKTIPTQVVGSGFTLSFGSFDPAGNPALFTGSIAVSLEFCADVKRTTLGSIACLGSWAPIAGVSASAEFNNASTTTANLPAIGNAYEIVRVKMVPPSGSPLYATDYFAVRPAALTLTASDADWQTAGGVNSLLAPATNKHRAGQPFRLNVASAASNYPGTLLSEAGLAPTASVEVAGAGMVAGVFSPGTWSATSGGLSSDTARYSEAGAMTLSLQDQHFADIDAADSTTAQRYFSGSASLQRFVPDHLTTTVTPPCGPFVYSQQPLSVKVTAYAFDSAAPTISRNYDATAGAARDVTLSDAGSVANFSNNSLPKSLFAEGVATDGDVIYAFPAAETAPQLLTLRAVDEDGVSSQGASEAAIEVRSGRVRVGNAYGSALLPLLLPVTVEYFKSSSERWVRNDAHTCSQTLQVPSSAVNGGLVFGPQVIAKNALVASEVVADIGGATAGGATLNFVLGRAAIKLRAPASAAAGPGKDNFGYVDLDLSASLVAWPNWLPSAGRGRGEFGIYKADRFIYRREVRGGP